MPNPVLDALTAEVASTVGAMQSAAVFINGTSARLEDAVNAALANGATAEQLAPITAEISAMRSQRDSLSNAIARNDNDPTTNPTDEEVPTGSVVDPNL